MKIAFLHHVFQMGSGIEQVILGLSQQLQLQGHDTAIITYDNERGQDSVPIAEFSLPTHSKLAGSVFAPLYSETNRNIREVSESFDVVVTSLYPMSVVPLYPHKINSKVVFIEWGIQPYSAFGSLIDKSYLWMLNRFDRYAIKKSDTVLVANEVTRQWVEKQGITPIKLHLYGINYDRLNVNADCEHLWERHPELEGAEGILMFAGRQSPHKNIELLIWAVDLLQNRAHNVKLLIVGRDSFPAYSHKLRKLVEKLGLENDVIFTGLVSEEDLAGYYNLCDVFVNASKWEGFLNPEPYAFKKPIIAYHVPPHDETVQKRITGLLVGLLKPYRFAQSIEYMMEYPEKRLAMGEAGYRWVKENLAFDIVARNFVKAIGE